MNVLTQTWRQLVRRRLWPVALLLVAALVAVPVVLAKPGTPPAPPADATAAAPVAKPAQSYVKLTSDDDPAQTKRRRVLGAPKDPFEPAPLPKKKKHAAKAATASATATATATATSTPAASGGTTGGTTTPVAPVSTATPAPKKHVPANSVEVRFGKTDGPMTHKTLARLQTLPSASSPVVVFMGFAHDGKDAVFMLTGTVTAEGDGHCDPSPVSCQTLLLRKGETEFLTFAGTKADGEYELDVNDIHTTKSASSDAEALVAKVTPTATVTATATATVAP
jgi:hypothetical protein